MKIYGVYKAWQRKGYQTVEGLQFDCFCFKKEDAIEKIKKQYNDAINLHNCRSVFEQYNDTVYFRKCGNDGFQFTVFEPYQEERGYAYLRLDDVEYRWNPVELEVKE